MDPNFTTQPTNIEITGDIQGFTNTNSKYDTLNEPVVTTILRDLKAIGNKFYHVFIPKKSQSLLKDWDLWGPLLLCIYLSLILQNSKTIQIDKSTTIMGRGPQFVEVFVLTWFGSLLITLNSKLLGGTLSLFQSLCILGYCLLPLAISLTICEFFLILFPIAFKRNLFLLLIRLVIVGIGFGWSCFASVAFLADSQPPRKKALCLYPIFLFYFVIAWLILSHS